MKKYNYIYIVNVFTQCAFFSPCETIVCANLNFHYGELIKEYLILCYWGGENETNGQAEVREKKKQKKNRL